MAVMLGRRSCTVYVDLATTSECALTITCCSALKASFKAAKHHIQPCRVELSLADLRPVVHGARSGR